MWMVADDDDNGIGTRYGTVRYSMSVVSIASYADSLVVTAPRSPVVAWNIAIHKIKQACGRGRVDIAGGR